MAFGILVSELEAWWAVEAGSDVGERWRRQCYKQIFHFDGKNDE